MGWAYVTNGDRSTHLHDLQLWALRHFLAEAAGALAAPAFAPAVFAGARAFLLNWAWHGPGVITGTELGDFVRGNRERERALLQICDQAVVRLREFGEVVSLAYLEANVNADSPGGIYLEEQPSELFAAAVERIRGILAA